MVRLLIVHDDSKLLDRLQRHLASREPTWEIQCAASVSDAWAAIESWEPAAVVALAKPPAVDGVELLARLQHSRPGTVRVVLGADADAEHSLRSLRIAHRAVAEPVDPGELLEVLRRMLLLTELVTRPGVREMLGRIGSLPAVPSVYTRLSQRLRDPNASVYELSQMIASDATLATQVLRIANSAYFGRHQPVTRIEAAAARLGTRLLRSIVLTAEVYARFPVSPFMAERLESLQQHASLVARLASSLEPPAAWKDDAFTAGLLHDIGKLLLAAHLPDVHASIVREAERTHRLEHEVELQRLGVHHGTLGACLLGMWGLPSVILEAAHAHHEPLAILPQPLTPVLAVAVADRLAHEVSPLAAPNAIPAPLPLAIRSDPRWPHWHALAAEVATYREEAA
jgi:putative nucleotidyltransferase with HDIG domain